MMDDTIQLDMEFDTGCIVGCILKPEFSEYHKLTFDSIELTYPKKYTFDWKNCDGMFAPNYKTDTNCWHIDFKKHRLEVLKNDTIIRGDLEYPITYGKNHYGIFTKIPATLISNKDTIQTNYTYLIDTGTPFAFAILDPDKYFLRFKNKSNHEETSRKGNKYICRINLDRIYLSPNIIIDSLKSFINYGNGSFKPSCPESVGTIGLGIFKHFDTYIDLKNKKLILKSYKN
jgi:hypothetical protein